MVKIYWVKDESIIQSIEFDKSICAVEDYPSLYGEIVEAIQSNQDLNILVVNSLVGKWIEILASRYGGELIEFSKVSARSIVESNIKITIPDNITDGEILGSKLLDLKIPSDGNESFEDYILRNFLAGFLNKPKFILLATQIQQEYQSTQWSDALRRPLVHKIYRNRLQQTFEEISKGNPDNKECLLELYSWFEKSPEFYLEQIAYLRILHTYPKEIGEHIFGEHFSKYSKIGLDAKNIFIPQLLREDISNELNLFFTKQRLTREEIDTVIQNCSGLLLLELEYIFREVQKANFQIDDLLIHSIEKKFTTKRNDPNFLYLLENLRNYLSLPKPEIPQSNWGERDMLDWAINQFLPYRFQLEDQDKLDKETIDLETIYSEWLYKNYPGFLYNSPNMAWKAFYNLKDEFNEYEGTTFVLMVDNLNLKFYPILQNLLNKSQFHQQQLHYCFSLLPSSTEISKKAIITGSYKPFSGGNYRKIVEQVWSDRLSKKVKYIANISELRSVQENAWDVYFLNYVPIDSLLHQSEKNTGINHKKIVSVYLTSLVQEITGFLNRFNLRQNCKLIILSDHGSTKIPEDTDNVLQDSFIKQHAIDEHHRFLSVTEEEFKNNSTEHEEFRYYALSAEKYDLQENFLIAKKYYRFKSGHDLSYVHGGLSPEETIIPVAVFEAKQVIPKNPEIRIISPETIIIGTRKTIELEITNHNNFPLKSLVITFPDQNVEIEHIYLDEVSQLSRIQTGSKYTCPVNAEITKTDLTISVRYDVEGMEYQIKYSLPMLFKSMIETKFDFDNL